jgi:uncharacterized protein involved in exopolysaccharide biosynthesis
MAEQTVDYDFDKEAESIPMMDQIVKHLTMVFQHRKTILLVWAVVTFLSLLYALFWPRVYASKATLMSISPPNPLGAFAMMSGDGGGGMDKLAGLGLAASEKDNKLVNILKSRTLAEDVIESSGFLPHKYRSKWDFTENDWKNPEKAVPMEKVVRHFKKNVWAVRLDKQDKLIEIRAQAKDPAMARAIAVAALNDLQNILNSKSFSVAGQNRRFIENRLQEVGKELAAAELEVKQFKEEHNLLDIEKQIGGALEIVAELESQLLARDMELGMMMKITTESNPKVQFIKNEIAQIKKQIDNVQLGDAEQASGNDLVPPLKQAPELALQFVRLKRKFMVQEKLFELLTTQYELAKIEEARDDLAFQVIDQPNLPVKADSPRKRVAVLLGCIFGVMFGLAVAYGRQYESEIRAIAKQIQGEKGRGAKEDEEDS